MDKPGELETRQLCDCRWRSRSLLRGSARFLILINLIFNFFGGQIWKGWKVAGIGVYDVKFQRINKKIKFKKYTVVHNF